MISVEGLVTGLHHVTLVTRNEAVNRKFYTEILGLRRVKLTVNQDDIYHRHLFYGDEKGRPGGTITFFEWPALRNGSVGLGSPHHLAYSVKSFDSFLKWKSWIARNNIPVKGPYLRDLRISIYLRDPDAVLLELTFPNQEGITSQYVQEASSNLPSVDNITTDMRLSLFNHATPISTDYEAVQKFLEKALGLRANYVRVNPDDSESSLVGVGNAESADFLLYLNNNRAAEGMVGVGSIHHIAVAVPDDEEQRKFLLRMNESGISNSGIVNRFWFKSLYFRDIFGNLLEIATMGPGYGVDEPPERLGSSLLLPPWLESQRDRIERKLAESDRQNPATWPPRYRDVPDAPERTHS